MKFTAVMDKIVAREIHVEVVSEAGLILPDSAQNSKPQIYCEVISVGDAVQYDIKPGDRFFTHANSGQLIVLDRDGKDLVRVYNEAEVYCLVDEEAS